MANNVINQINDATVFQSTVAINQGTEWADIYGKPNGLTQQNINKWIAMSESGGGGGGSEPVSIADKETYGIVKVGDRIDVNEGVISVPLATTQNAGSIIVGQGLHVDQYGVLNSDGGSIATTETAGIIKVGADFDIAQDGTLSLYKAITISSFSISPSLKEVGETVSSLSYNYSCSKIPTSAEVGGSSVTLNTASGSGTLSGSWTTNTQIYFKVKDAKTPNWVSTYQTLTFGYYVYGKYSSSQLTPSGITDTVVKGWSDLHAIKSNGSTDTLTFPSQSFLYIATPSSWGTPTYVAGVLSGNFVKIKDIANLNSGNNTTNYTVWCSSAENQFPSGQQIKLTY